MNRKVKISGVEMYVPPKVLTNEDFEKMVDTSNEWILERTGIRERHIVEKGVANSDLASEALKRLCDSKGITPEDIELIIIPTVTPDMFSRQLYVEYRKRPGQKMHGVLTFQQHVLDSFSHWLLQKNL